MTFTYLMGFLALIGIPILIIIYIIKNKYTEQTVTSTYLWTLSERFIKKRIPINRIVGIISLILQIIAVALISLCLVHPVLILKGSASAYCFVLDGSGSMNIVQNGTTRFETGKERIEDMISSAANGSKYTLILATDTAETIFTELTDKDRALELLDTLEPSFISPDPVEALDATQEYFDSNRSALNYLVTDKDYEDTRNITVINITEGADSLENYAVTSADHRLVDGIITVFGTVTSYVSDATVTVDVAFPSEEGCYVSVGSVNVEATKGVPAEFSVPTGRTEFKSLKVSITNPDSFKEDSEQILFNISNENIGNTLVVSDGSSFFIRGALAAIGNIEVDVCTTEEYAAGVTGNYGLFVFDGCLPSEMPEDGSVWFLDPPGTVKGTNFTYQGTATPRSDASYSTYNSTTVRKLLGGVSGNRFPLARYVKCGVSGMFSTLASVDGSSVIFAGTNEFGNREVVFAFSFNDSAPFIMSSDFPTLIGNLLEYSFPAVIDETSYYCGETLPINVVSGCDSLLLNSPSGRTIYLDTATAVSEYKLDEVGVYEVQMTMKNDGGVRTFNVFSAVPESERTPIDTGMDFRITGMAIDGKFDGFYDNLLIIFIVLAVVAAADFGVYCYEQYQLR